LWEEFRPRAFENRLQRRIFGPKRDAVTGEWRKLHNEELHNLHSSSIFYQVKEDMGRACSMNMEKRIAYRILVRKLAGKRLVGRQRRRRGDNIKRDLIDVEWNGMN
jgi:hypothetical protein